MVDTSLSYCLSWHVLPSDLKDGLNSYIFLLAISIMRRVQFALFPLYFGSLYARLNECLGNALRAMERYDLAC